MYDPYRRQENARKSYYSSGDRARKPKMDQKRCGSNQKKKKQGAKERSHDLGRREHSGEAHRFLEQHLPCVHCGRLGFRSVNFASPDDQSLELKSEAKKCSMAKNKVQELSFIYDNLQRSTQNSIDF